MQTTSATSDTRVRAVGLFGAALLMLMLIPFGATTKAEAASLRYVGGLNMQAACQSGARATPESYNSLIWNCEWRSLSSPTKGFAAIGPIKRFWVPGVVYRQRINPNAVCKAQHGSHTIAASTKRQGQFGASRSIGCYRWV